MISRLTFVLVLAALTVCAGGCASASRKPSEAAMTNDSENASPAAFAMRAAYFQNLAAIDTFKVQAQPPASHPLSGVNGSTELATFEKQLFLP